MNELISVIVPIYAVEQYLRECIESIRAQTYQNLEIILVDDGSPDGCPKICDEYARVDRRIKVIHQANGGTDSARKAGMRIATGNYVGYVDGDDWIEPEMYEKLYRLAIDSGCSIVESGVIDSWVGKEVRRMPYIKEGAFIGDSFKKYVEPYFIYSGTFYQNGLFPYLVNKIFKKSSIEYFQMTNEDNKNIVDDVMCVYPAIESAQSVYITHECFYHYRVRDDSTKRIIRTDVPEIVKDNYSKWIGRFSSPSAKSQMVFLIMYLLIAKAPLVFDSKLENTYLLPYGEIRKTDRIVLYGAGAVGIPLQNYIVNIAKGNLVLWVDKNYKQLQGHLSVQNPEDILQSDFDYIIIGIMWRPTVESVKKDLEMMGVKKEKIMWIQDKYLETPELLISEFI